VGLTCRLVTSLTVLLVMLGLPVAPVICDLACPQATTVAPVAAPPTVVSTSGHVPCHEATTAAAAAAPDDGLASQAATSVLVLASRPMHGCDHPVVVASRGTFEGFRLLAPVVALDAAPHLGARQAPHARIVRLASARPPSPGPSGAFSPILRI
jgi:hypothetical protein